MRIQCLFPTILACTTAFAQAPILPIGGNRELFCDHHLIEKLDGAQLRLATPVARETVLKFDAPWEGRYCGYVTVLQDSDRYRMYYRGLPKAGKDGSDAEVTCYAESMDGAAWAKPSLGLHEAGGSTDNNIVLAGAAPYSHNFAPFLDARPGVPQAERYKAIAGTSDTGLHGFVSADGLRWQKLDGPLITEGAFDSQNVAFWSEAEGQYLCYFRTWSEGGYSGFRTVSRATSADFQTWSAPAPMAFGDTPMEHLYTNQTHPYYRAPQVYVSLAARFMPGRRVLSAEAAAAAGVEEQYAGDCSDSVFITSRGGSVYDRTFMEGFIKPGIGLNNWSSRTNYPACGIVSTGEQEMSFYVQADYGQPTHHLVRHTLRPDGFASVWGPYAVGEMVTKPFKFTGDRLLLNFATSAAGGLRVEVQDAAGAPVPGFALDDCPVMLGNFLDQPVVWRDAPKLGALAGQPIRLRFELQDAELFALRFAKGDK